MIRLVALASAAALTAGGCAGGGESVPEWVKERADAAIAPYLEVAYVEATEYEEGEREWRVIHALDRVVPCQGCSRPAVAGEPQRGDMVENRWDRRTRRHTAFAFCTSGRLPGEPLSGCSKDPP